MITVMLVLSLILTAMMSVFTVLIATVNRAVPPVIVSLVATAFFAWVSVIYLRNRKWRNRKTVGNKKAMRKLKINNLILAAPMLLSAFSMWSILLVTAILHRVFFEFQIYFLIVAVVTTAYTISGISIYNELDSALAEVETVRINTIDP